MDVYVCDLRRLGSQDPKIVVGDRSHFEEIGHFLLFAWRRSFFNNYLIR